MTRDVQAHYADVHFSPSFVHYADVNLTGDLDQITNAQLGAIDLLASLLTGETGWRVRVEIDPGTVIVATPPVRDDAPGTESDFTARFTGQDAESREPATPTPDNPTDGQESA